jgi:hypothetical protein
MGIRKCGYSHINTTFKYKDPRIAWIGNPPQQNCMVEAGTGSLPAKVHPEKKPQSKKNSTVIDREFDSLSATVEFFDLRIFSLGALLRANCC